MLRAVGRWKGRNRLCRRCLWLFIVCSLSIPSLPISYSVEFGGLWDEIRTRSPKTFRNDLRQTMISLGAHPNNFSNGRSSHRRIHNFLECHCIAGMYSAIQDVEERNWHHIGCFQSSGFQSQKLIERNSLARISHLHQFPSYILLYS